MAAMSKEEFIAMVEGMTVLELHDIVKALEDRFGLSLLVPAEPQTAGALGAALIAREEGRKVQG